MLAFPAFSFLGADTPRMLRINQLLTFLKKIDVLLYL